ncbi:MAG: phosphodiester glycosidase family protein [Clostridiales bacterium]|nr:phosphodiester glycosidase family protein [Clostridiales bacterium]
MRKYLFGLVYGLLLAAFTAYVALDTFVLVRVYSIADQAPAQTSDVQPTTAPALVTSHSYTDANITLTLTEYREHDTTIYVADVLLSSPTLLKTALAQDAYGRNVTETTSTMAERTGAILAINGDYYGSREGGYVVRNGVTYRNTAMGNEALTIMADGSFRIAEEGRVSVTELVEDGAVQVLSFGPALVVDGRVSVTEHDEVGHAMANNPRTAIGIISPGHYLLAVSDGRTKASSGLTLRQLADFMLGLGASTAYNLDGGGSSTMVFMGEVVNQPTTNGRSIRERSVSDIVYIGY